MAHFDKGGAGPDPFGKNVYLRSTDPKPQRESYTFAHETLPMETVNGKANQRILQSGEVLAKITSGAHIGKVGVFQAGVTDGRESLDNIVGVNDTFLPWQLLHRDVEVAATYDCTAVQAWCFERNAAGARIALTNTTADAMRGKRGLDVKFK